MSYIWKSATILSFGFSVVVVVGEVDLVVVAIEAEIETVCVELN